MGKINHDRERLWNARQDMLHDRYVDRMLAAHDHGDHDFQGEEAEECPACETRRIDEEAAMWEEMEENIK